MKRIMLISGFLAISLMLQAQHKPLAFDTNGRFKIVQFTDVHYKKEDPESAVALQLINKILDTEKPDLVVFTGDIIFAKPVKEGLDDVFAPVENRKIPWAYVFGNHDDEFEVSREELMEYVVQKTYCIARSGDKSLSGVGNYIHEIKDISGKETKALLYFMDSKAYSTLQGIKGYDWFAFDQIDWFKKQSAAYTGSHAGEPYPALAFFHIPLAEYGLMAKNDSIIGSRKEEECAGKLNSGMFAAMRQAGDVMGVFVGHDHDNDYIGNYYDIYLAYGRYSGGKTVYNNLGLNGCRIIELQEGVREFNTYIRLLNDEKLYPVRYPDTFRTKEKDKN